MTVTANGWSEAPYRPMPSGPRSLKVEKRPDGAVLLQSDIALVEYERSICDNLERWSREAPDRTWLAQRNGANRWETLSYADGWARTQAIGQSLLDLGLSKGGRLAILSGNSIEHALMMMAGMAIGLAIAPISPSYSLLPAARDRLLKIAQVLRPEAVFVQRYAPFAHVRGIPEFADAKWVSADDHDATFSLASLEASAPNQTFTEAFLAVEPDMAAKILFTSGSTGSPKGAINTHRMLTSSVAMTRSIFPGPRTAEFPVQVEWLPWHHTTGGNAIFNTVLKAGGSLYIDPGRPTPDAFHLTIAALREVSPTSMVNVPAGLALLVEAMEGDAGLSRSVFERLERISTGGAAAQAELVERFQKLAVAAVGKRIPFFSAYGSTETALNITMTYWPTEQSAELGLPMPGLELKLVPNGDRYEVRVRGPSVTPGYLGGQDPGATTFDDEGFYCTGDAATFIDPAEPSVGLRFAGRLNENFKLTSGTWVMTGDVRLAVLTATRPLLQEIVIAGENRDAVTILGWINKEAARAHVQDVSALADPARLATDIGILTHIKWALERYNQNTTSSTRISAFRILADPPSVDGGEITDKASVNRRMVLKNRAHLVDELYRAAPAHGVIRL